MSSLKHSIHIYIAMNDWHAQSRMEDLLVLDGFDVSTFTTPQGLWEHFQSRPARFVIVDHSFDDDSNGLDLVKKIREKQLSPYVYILVRSTVEQLSEIEEALAAGANDCLVSFKLHDPFQIRSRILVGLQWLDHIDSLGRAAAKIEIQTAGAPAPAEQIK